MKNYLIQGLAISTVILFTSSANSATTYNESVSGDLDGNFVTNFFNLTVGTSVFNGQISESITFDSNGDPSLFTGDLDDFYFNVASGFEITSINFTVNSTSISGSDPLPLISFFTNFYIIENGASGAVNSFLGHEIYKSDFPVALPFPIINDTLSLGESASYYYLANSIDPSWLPTESKNTNITADFDYTIQIEVAAVSAVPVPAAAWLFGLGLIGLIGVARRKKV